MRRFAAPIDDAGVIRSRSSLDSEPDGPRHDRFARLVGAAGMLALTLALFWLVSDDDFRVSESDVTITGIRFADAAAVRDHISGISRSPNVFRVRAGDIVSDLGALPEVRFARASVSLPAVVTVDIVERRPIFIWSNGGEAWFVDDSGVLFSPRDAAAVTAARSAGGDAAVEAVADDEAAASGRRAAADASVDADGDDAVGEAAGAPDTGPDGQARADEAAVDEGAADEGAADEGAADEAAADEGAAGAIDELMATLPLLEDARIVEQSFVSGDRLPAIDFAVMRQLLGVTPELIGSQAGHLSLRIDQQDGYVLENDRLGWHAVFGHYRANVQPPDVVPLQVQCLTALLESRPERRIDRVWLVTQGGSCGTFRMVRGRGSDA